MRKRQVSLTSMSSPNPLTVSSDLSKRPVISGPLPLQKRTPTKQRVSSTHSAASTASRYSGESYRSTSTKASVASSVSNLSSPSRYSGESYRSNGSKDTATSSQVKLTPILKHSVSSASSLNSTSSSLRPKTGRRSLPSDGRRHAVIGMPALGEDEDDDMEMQSYASYFTERSFVVHDAPANVVVDEPHARRQRNISTSTGSSRSSTRARSVSATTSSENSNEGVTQDDKPLPPVPEHSAFLRPRLPSTPSKRVKFASDEEFDIAHAISLMLKRFQTIQSKITSGEPLDLATLNNAFSDALGSVLDALGNIPWNVRGSTAVSLAWEDVILNQQLFLKRSSMLVTNDEDGNGSDLLKSIEGTMFATKHLLRGVQEQLDLSRIPPPLPFGSEDDAPQAISPQLSIIRKPRVITSDLVTSRAASIVSSVGDLAHSTPDDDTVAHDHVISTTKSPMNSSESLSSSPNSSGFDSGEDKVSTLFSRRSSSDTNSSIGSFSEDVLHYLEFSDIIDHNQEIHELDMENNERQDFVGMEEFPPTRPRPLTVRTLRRGRSTNSLANQQLFDSVRASVILFPEFTCESVGYVGGIPEDETDCDEVLYGNGQNGRFLKGLSLRRIIAEICSKNSLNDPEFTEMVLLCFRHWCNSEVFCQNLIDLYRLPALTSTPLWSTMEEKEQVQLRVIRVFKIWLNHFWSIEKDREAYGLLITFAECFLSRDFELAAKNIIEGLTKLYSQDGAPLKRCQRRAETARKNFVTRFEIPRGPSIALQRQLKEKQYKSIGPLQLQKGLGASSLALHLTLMEAQLYSVLDPEEILEHYICKREHSSGSNEDSECSLSIAERLTKHAEFTSHLTSWVSQCILRMTEPSLRASIFDFFINVAKKCVELRNFSSAHSIWVGLTSNGIDRLPLTKVELDKNSHACNNFAYLTQIFDASKHFAACRELLRKNNEPAIPLIGVYRHLFNSLTETVKLFLDSNSDPGIKLINVSVCRKLSSIVQEMEATHATYDIKGNESIIAYLDFVLKKAPSADELTTLCRHFRIQEEDSMQNKPSQILRPILDHFNSIRSQND